MAKSKADVSAYLFVLTFSVLSFAGIAGNNFASAEEPKAAAATNAEVVVSEPADRAEVTVYGSAFAQVQETRTVKLNAGRNRVQLNGVAAKYRTDSLRVVDAKGPGSFTYRSATYQPASLTPERLLAESVGKRVKVRRASGEKEGTLQTVSGGTLVVKIGESTEFVSGHEVTLCETPTGLSNTASLVVEADVTTGGDYQLTFLYETEGLTWSAKHSLIFDEPKSTVRSWEATVSLVNDSGTTFKNATVRLLTDRVTQGEGRVEAAMYAASTARSADAPGGAATESVGDQKQYTLPGTIDLAAGQTRQVPLFNAANVPVKRAYVVSTYAARAYSAETKFEAQIRLTVDNCDKHNLGKAIPGGLVKVYQYNSANGLLLTGSTQVGSKAENEVFDLNIGTSPDVKWDVKPVGVKTFTADDTADGPSVPAPVRPRTNVGPATQAQLQTNDPAQQKAEFEDRTYELTVYNFKKDQPVEVKIDLVVPGKQELGPKWLRPRTDRAEQTVTVSQSDKNSVRYTIRTRTR